MKRRAVLAQLAAAPCLWLGHVSGLRAEPAARSALTALLAKLAKVEALSASFREEKHMALLAAPLISSGRLYYQRPDLLARHTHSPRASSLLLRGHELTLGDAAHHETLDLGSQPAVRALVETFVALLSGNRGALEGSWRVEVDSSAQRFTVRLSPLAADLSRLVKALAFAGSENRLEQLEVHDANGDRSLTTFSEIELRATFGPEEAARYFRVAS